MNVRVAKQKPRRFTSAPVWTQSFCCLLESLQRAPLYPLFNGRRGCVNYTASSYFTYLKTGKKEPIGAVEKEVGEKGTAYSISG